MLSVERRRPFGSAEAPRVEPFPASQDKGSQPITPQPLTACPLTNRRPRDLDAYRAAVAATDRPVTELDAVEAQPGMTLWHLGRWRTIADIQRDGNAVLLWLLGDGVTPSRYASHDAPLYRLA